MNGAWDCLATWAKFNNFCSPISSALPRPVPLPARLCRCDASTSPSRVCFCDEKCTEGALITRITHCIVFPGDLYIEVREFYSGDTCGRSSHKGRGSSLHLCHIHLTFFFFFNFAVPLPAPKTARLTPVALPPGAGKRTVRDLNQAPLSPPPAGRPARGGTLLGHAQFPREPRFQRRAKANHTLDYARPLSGPAQWLQAAGGNTMTIHQRLEGRAGVPH